jgi:hypothetical protein
MAWNCTSRTRGSDQSPSLPKAMSPTIELNEMAADVIGKLGLIGALRTVDYRFQDPQVGVSEAADTSRPRGSIFFSGALA